MTKTEAKTNEIDPTDLEAVSGGTVTEYDELLQSLVNNPLIGQAHHR